MQTFDIPATKLVDARRRVMRANHRLRAAGITEEFTIAEAPYSKVVTDKGGVPRQVDRVKVTLSRPTIAYEGYTFLARVEEVSAGNFLAYTAPGVELNGWRPTSMECEHCHKKRARSKVYVVSDDQGNYKTVGKTCVELYTGMTPEGLFALEWDELRKHHTDDWEREDVSYGTPVYNADAIIALAVNFVREEGYRSTAYYNSTKDRILSVLSPSSPEENAATASLLKAAEKVDVPFYRDSMEKEFAASTNDWATNVKAVLNLEWISVREIGLLASGVAPIVKNEVKEETFGAALNEFFSYEGAKFKVAAVLEEKKYVSDYGYYSSGYYRMTFRTEDGYVLVWKTSTDTLPAVNARLMVFGRVKRHNEWRGRKTTLVTRVKVLEV